MKGLKMKQHDQEGKLITFCGLDGCGKTTIINMLKDKLAENGIESVLTKQPTDDVRKTKIFRTFMDSPNHEKYAYRALSLMAASDRVQHSNKVILPLLEEEKTVISDRYIYSCLANLRARGYKKDNWIYEIARDIPKPDLSFFLDVPVELAVSRVRSREDEKNRYIDLKLQHQLRKEYISICAASGGILLSTDKNVEDTFSQVWSCVEKLYGNIVKDDIKNRIYNLLHELTGVDVSISEKTELTELSIDSLRMALLLIEIEKRFGIELDESDMNPLALKTVEDIIKLAEKYSLSRAESIIE